MPPVTARREGLHVSYSQLRCWQLCPRQFELKYVLGAPPEFTPIALGFGASVHHGLAQFYGHVKLYRQFPDLEEVIAAFRDEWERFSLGPVPIRASGDEDEDPDLGTHVDRGVQLLTMFHAHAVRQQLPDVHAVELPFTVEIPDPTTGEILDQKLTGYIDLILSEEGRKIVVEHKTSSRKYGGDQLKFEPQLSCYQLAAREVGFGEVGLRYQILVKTKTPSMQIEDVRRDEVSESDFLYLASGILRAISAGIFWPNRSWACRSCPLQSACAARR